MAPAQAPVSDRPIHRTSTVDDLEEELESFRREKEQVRAIVGAIGGKPRARMRVVIVLFLIVVGAAVIVAVIGGEVAQSLMVELTMLALSIKIIYLIHRQMRVTHFKFWMLSSLEWRICEIARQVKELEQSKKDSREREYAAR